MTFILSHVYSVNTLVIDQIVTALRMCLGFNCLVDLAAFYAILSVYCLTNWEEWFNDS